MSKLYLHLEAMSMKSITRLLLLGVAAGVLLPAQMLQPSDDYTVGRKVGECLVVKCQVFTGWLDTESPQFGHPILIRLEAQLFGPKISSDSVAIPFADPNARFREPR